MWGFYIPIMLCVGVIVYSLLRHYAAPGVPLFVRIVVSVAWTTSLSIVALVPIDVWNTLQHKSGGTGGPIGVMWSISYWTSQAMTWILVPWTMGFVDDGNFTWFRRLFGSIRGNMVFHASVGSIVIIGVILLLATGQLTFSALPQLALTLSNTYGLVAGVFLLGFGLVEIPRALWNASDPEGRLQYLQYRVGRTADTLEDAAFELQSVITVVEATHQPMSRRDPLRPLMDKIYEYAERHSPFSPSMCTKDSSGRINLDDLKDGDLDYGCDEVGLASLRQRLRRAVHNFEGDKASYVNAVQAACNLEVIVKCRQSGDYTQRAVPASAQQSHSKEIMIYKCIVHPWVLKLCSLVLAGISFMVVWSEATIGSGRSPDLSPFSQAIHAAKHGEVATQLLVMAPLVYMCMCCHYALMRLGVLKFGWLMRMGIGFVYHMVPHCTHSQSLLRNGGWVCRFIAPICYNFLHVIRMHLYLSAGETTVFSKKMGKALSDVPIFGQGFNSWFPIVVVVWCGMLFLNVWGGVARVCLPSRYRFSEGGSSEHHERGRLLLRKEQDCLLRGRPISEALDLWGTCEAPGTPGARARIAAGSKGKPTAGATSRLGMAPEAAEDSKTAKRWSRSNLSAATQAALGGAVEPPSLSGSSQAPPAAKGPQLKHSLMQHKHGSNDSLGGMARPSPPGHSGGSRAVGGLDDIFARMSPSTSGTGTGRIDDDEDDSRDGNLLGSAEDSLAGTHVSWQARRGGK